MPQYPQGLLSQTFALAPGQIFMEGKGLRHSQEEDKSLGKAQDVTYGTSPNTSTLH